MRAGFANSQGGNAVFPVHKEKAKLEGLTSQKDQDWEVNLTSFRANEAGTCWPDPFVLERQVYSEMKARLQLWRMVWRFLKKLEIELPYDPAIPLLEKTLESPLGCKEIQPVHPKGNHFWIFLGWTDIEAEFPYCGHLM